MKTRDEIKELLELDEDELDDRLTSAEEELMNLRFRHASGQLEQSAQIKNLRRRIARIKTVTSQKRESEVNADAS